MISAQSLGVSILSRDGIYLGLGHTCPIITLSFIINPIITYQNMAEKSLKDKRDRSLLFSMQTLI